ncbi:hypothetical protein NLK61_20795 [Pseudomonas fuscovaginae UPB0736]|uniref:Uncharacterized protein n=1 Tax=Pseudomonas asplenii TaxID=53407 RepID=A0A1H6PAE9_9PSED|nr:MULTISPECIES: hypothetical protein [Pseudomonas]UUQ63673.1 hypothetical protein NLK61_20795 [Pseudomonas fuscovaginae UPB0736]UZE27828.1 hypothetical protein LOY63_21085 [Pseudomonas asplenii]SEI24632.1 hypothetical protein SAMN05216581_5568 [Pseudomonas fuscovaginae]
MKDRNSHPLARPSLDRLMDPRMIGPTLGGACLANMLFPGLVSALAGALVGAFAAFQTTATL